MRISLSSCASADSISKSLAPTNMELESSKLERYAWRPLRRGVLQKTARRLRMAVQPPSRTRAAFVMIDYDIWQRQPSTLGELEDNIRADSRQAHELVERARRSGLRGKLSPRRIDRVVIIPPEYDGALFPNDEKTKGLARERRRMAEKPDNEEVLHGHQDPATVIPLTQAEERSRCGVYAEESREHPRTIYLSGAFFSHGGEIHELEDMMPASKDFFQENTKKAKVFISNMAFSFFGGDIKSGDAKVIDDGAVDRFNEYMKKIDQSTETFLYKFLPEFNEPIISLRDGSPASSKDSHKLGRLTCYDAVSGQIKKEMYKISNNTHPIPSNRLDQLHRHGRDDEEKIINRYRQPGRGHKHSEKMLDERDWDILGPILSRDPQPVPRMAARIQMAGTNRPYDDEAIGKRKPGWRDDGPYFFVDKGPRPSCGYDGDGHELKAHEASSQAGGRLLCVLVGFREPLP